jgi:hypothetical protein
MLQLSFGAEDMFRLGGTLPRLSFIALPPILPVREVETTRVPLNPLRHECAGHIRGTKQEPLFLEGVALSDEPRTPLGRWTSLRLR